MSVVCLNLSIVIRKDIEDGGYVVECVDIPGCLSQGATVEEAIANIREAAEGCLLSMIQHGDPLPTGESLLATIPVEVSA